MANLEKPTMNKLPALPWKWKESNGPDHVPSEMETRHLFYTLRMIWNHTMPESVRFHPYQHYAFSAFYTPEYLQQAIHFIGHELLNRPDIKPKWQAELASMAEHFADRPPEALVTDLKVGELAL